MTTIAMTIGVHCQLLGERKHHHRHHWHLREAEIPIVPWPYSPAIKPKKTAQLLLPPEVSMAGLQTVASRSSSKRDENGSRHHPRNRLHHHRAVNPSRRNHVTNMSRMSELHPSNNTISRPVRRLHGSKNKKMRRKQRVSMRAR